MNTFCDVPPGFRFHPTDEELVDYYLRKKVGSRRIDLDVIKDVDLYKIEPWDLQEICRIGREEENEWYFFSHKDKKYPTGTRTNRATAAGFWKATGRDKAIYSKHELIGMRKTLVFYKGRAPNGQKSDWIMHEYRLETDENAAPQEEGWVVCRVFKKRITTMRKVSEEESCSWYDDKVSLMQHLDSPNQTSSSSSQYPSNSNNKLHFPINPHFLHLPLLESPKLLQPSSNNIPPFPPLHHVNHTCTSLFPTQHHQQQQQQNFYDNINIEQGGGASASASVDQVTDWRVLDKFVASQLSQDDFPCKDNNAPNIFHATDATNLIYLDNKEDQQIVLPPNVSTSNTTSPIHLWK